MYTCILCVYIYIMLISVIYSIVHEHETFRIFFPLLRDYLYFTLQHWSRPQKRCCTVKISSSCWRWCWRLATTWTKDREATHMASKSLRSTRLQTPSPALTSEKIYLCVYRRIKNTQWFIFKLLLLPLSRCRNITLLHYLITILEKKYSKVMLFSEELQNVPEAAKVK